MEPTKKSKGIEDLLTSMTGISRQEALEKEICVWCKKPIVNFRDELSMREYTISGFCQSCQDETFGGDDE